jgi:hypothetical protein
MIASQTQQQPNQKHITSKSKAY